MRKFYGPMVTSNSTSPTMSLLDPSKALTIVVLGLMLDGSISRRCRVARGHTLSEDPLSIRTHDTILPIHLVTMNGALVCCPLASPNSSGKKEICSIEKMESTI